MVALKLADRAQTGLWLSRVGSALHLAPAAYWVWWLLVVAIVAAALWRSTSRERIVLAVTVVLALAFPVLFYAWVYRFSGFGLQGRYTLPVLVLISMLAGELLHRHPPGANAINRSRALVAGAVALIACFQAYAWWENARTTAGARGTVRFYAFAVWSPLLGWWPWILIAAFGVVCLLSVAGRALQASAR